MGLAGHVHSRSRKTCRCRRCGPRGLHRRAASRAASAVGHGGRPSSRAARSRPGSGAPTERAHQPLCHGACRQGKRALTVPDFSRPKNEVMAGVGVGRRGRFGCRVGSNCGGKRKRRRVHLRLRLAAATRRGRAGVGWWWSRAAGWRRAAGCWGAGGEAFLGRIPNGALWARSWGKMGGRMGMGEHLGALGSGRGTGRLLGPWLDGIRPGSAARHFQANG